GPVGVLLTWRAPVAILLGVALQMFIVGHGGFSTIGVNACTQAIPAVLAGYLFLLLRRVGWWRTRFGRAALVGLAGGLWAWLVVFGVVVLLTNPLRELVIWSPRAGLVVSLAEPVEALRASLHPAALAGVLAVAVAAG